MGSRRQYRALAAAAVVFAIVGLWISPVSAHTALVGASPGPDETAGGAIDFIDLAFSDPVSNAKVTVSYNGEPLPGITTVTDGQIIRFELDTPLELAGRYEVTFEMISFDTDETSSAFFFTFTADAPEPLRIGLTDGQGPTDGGSGGTDPVLIGAVVAITGLVGVLAVFVWRANTRRQPEADWDR